MICLGDLVVNILYPEYKYVSFRCRLLQQQREQEAAAAAAALEDDEDEVGRVAIILSFQKRGRTSMCPELDGA